MPFTVLPVSCCTCRTWPRPRTRVFLASKYIALNACRPPNKTNPPYSLILLLVLRTRRRLRQHHRARHQTPRPPRRRKRTHSIPPRRHAPRRATSRPRPRPRHQRKHALVILALFKQLGIAVPAGVRESLCLFLFALLGGAHDDYGDG